MSWVSRYAAAVERSLPAAGREDVGEEILPRDFSRKVGEDVARSVSEDLGR